MPSFEFCDTYKMTRRLGEGGFGAVYKVTQRSTGRTYAAKVIQQVLRFSYDELSGEEIPDEILLWRNLRHSNIIRYVEHFKHHHTWIIIMEYCPGYEDLYEYMNRKDKNFDELRAASIVSQLLTTISYLKRKGVDHRDIKLENLLYNPRTKKIKLIDFGCASRITSRPYRVFQGTEDYYPPEWFDRKEYTYAAGTVWSIGLLTYILLNGKTPFPSRSDSDDVSPASKMKKIHWRRRHLSPMTKKFIKKCLRLRPKERYTLDDMMKAKWLSLSNYV